MILPAVSFSIKHKTEENCGFAEDFWEISHPDSDFLKKKKKEKAQLCEDNKPSDAREELNVTSSPKIKIYPQMCTCHRYADPTKHPARLIQLDRNEE